MKKKNITIRYPEPLWRRLKMLEIDGYIDSISSVTIEAVTRAVNDLEKKARKDKDKRSGAG